MKKSSKQTTHQRLSLSLSLSLTHTHNTHTMSLFSVLSLSLSLSLSVCVCVCDKVWWFVAAGYLFSSGLVGTTSAVQEHREVLVRFSGISKHSHFLFDMSNRKHLN